MGRRRRRNGRGDIGDACPPDSARPRRKCIKTLRFEFSRFELLRLLAFSRSGALPITKASDRLQVHVTSVTHAIRRLEANGLVQRIPHPTDGRTTLVQITDLGRSTVEDATVTLNEQVFADIGLSERESRRWRRRSRRCGEAPATSSRCDGTGIVAVTAVPEPGRDRMFSLPPTSSARSAIDSTP